jgi:hypothetical protein
MKELPLLVVLAVTSQGSDRRVVVVVQAQLGQSVRCGERDMAEGGQ